MNLIWLHFDLLMPKAYFWLFLTLNFNFHFDQKYSQFFLMFYTKKWFHRKFSISSVFSCMNFFWISFNNFFNVSVSWSMIFLFLDANTTATLNRDFGFSRIYRFWRSSRFVGFNKIKRRQTMKYPIKTNKLIFMVFQTKENTKSETYT